MSNGYVSSIARCSNPNKISMHGMKNHDYHVLTECLLPIVFSSLLEFVWSALVELSQFLKDLCCNRLRTDDVVRIEENISIILCKLETIFLPASFDSMEHFVIHLPMKVLLGCPV